jgi:hypothetical protein
MEARKRQKGYDAQARRRQETVADRIGMWERIEKVVKEMDEGCPVCWFLEDSSGRGEYNHGLGNCTAWTECFQGLSMRAIRVKYVDYGGLKTTCYSCGLPGDRCQDYRTAGARCRRENYVVAAVSYFWKQRDSRYYSVVQTVLGRVFDNFELFGVELVKPVRVLEENGSMAFKIWVEILKARDR